MAALGLPASVTAFNGARYRQRHIPEVIEELRSVREKRVFVVDDNLIGTRPAQIQARAKELFRALIEASSTAMGRPDHDRCGRRGALVSCR